MNGLVMMQVNLRSLVVLANLNLTSLVAINLNSSVISFPFNQKSTITNSEISILLLKWLYERLDTAQDASSDCLVKPVYRFHEINCILQKWLKTLINSILFVIQSDEGHITDDERNFPL